MRFLVVLHLIVAKGLLAQNLVINPSFEEYYRCPASFSTDSRDFFLPGWSSANKGTPDHYHQCSWSDNDVPFNWAGQSNAHTGLGYAGIYTWSNTGKNYREYMQCELQSPLVRGNRYKVEFYFKLSSYSVYATDRIGLIFSDSLLSRVDDKTIRQAPALHKIRETSFTENKWEVASMEYVAKGGEKALVIGNFSEDRNTHHIKIDSRMGKSFMLSTSAYYYIDDVSVVALDLPVPRDTLVWTDGREIRTDEVYILKNIQFEFDSYELVGGSYPELEKLVKVMHDRPQWRVELTGHTDDQGSEEYNLELSENRAESVGEYLRARGISELRILTRGFGKQYPLVDKVDEDARSVNRRVEVRFLK